MNILMVASELAPLAGEGELAAEMAGLCGELKALGHDVRVVLPYYRAVREGKAAKAKKTRIKFSVPLGSARCPCEIHEGVAPNGVKVFLVARDEYFDRSGLYGAEGRDYQDNAARFIFLTKCALELARRMEPPPQILHVHGWQAALAPVFVRDYRLPFPTVLTPHGLEYQGNFWSYDFALTNLPGDYFSPRGVEFYGSMNCLKGGLLFADAVVVPSEIFVRAAQAPRWGCGLEAILLEQQHKLVGIPVDRNASHWDPAVDKALAAPFSKPSAREKNRAALQTALGWEPGDGRVLFTVLAAACVPEHAGLLLDGLDRLLADDVQLAVLGPLPETNSRALEIARRKHARRFVQRTDCDEALVRLALAGTDFLVLPGPAEPSGTWLIRALRYGAVPVAYRCGGLPQFIKDGVSREEDNGVIYWSATTEGLLDALRRAVQSCEDGGIAALRSAGKAGDYSRAGAARRHLALYESLALPGGMARAA